MKLANILACIGVLLACHYLMAHVKKEEGLFYKYARTSVIPQKNVHKIDNKETQAPSIAQITKQKTLQRKTSR